MLVCLGKRNRPAIDHESSIIICLHRMNSHIAPGYWVRLERGIAKNIAPGVCLFSYMFYKSPPMPGWGEWGLTLIGALIMMTALLEYINLLI